jgi:hypothetical protein
MAANTSADAGLVLDQVTIKPYTDVAEKTDKSSSALSANNC